LDSATPPADTKTMCIRLQNVLAGYLF
jgi:hypothetical protein